MSTTNAGPTRARDVVIVGGGPAGLSAALILGRCRRQVLLCDAGKPRNAASHALHGFLSRDGIAPAELLRIGREELRRYENVEVRDVEVVDAVHDDAGFTVKLADGTTVRCRKLLLATGVADRLPLVLGFDAIYGISAFHCPYCDGWEFRDQPVAVYAPDRMGLGLALQLTCWTESVTLCTDGPSSLTPAERDRLALHGIALREERVEAFESTAGRVERVAFRAGPALECRGLFFNLGNVQSCALASRLGCEVSEKGAVTTREDQSTKTRGLYVAGDADQGSHFAIIAAGEGAQAAIRVNTALAEEDLARAEDPSRAR